MRDGPSGCDEGISTIFGDSSADREGISRLGLAIGSHFPGERALLCAARFLPGDRATWMFSCTRRPTAALACGTFSSPATIGTWVSMAGCFILLAGQAPMSVDAWHIRSPRWAYTAMMAQRIDQLSKNPMDVTNCVPELIICKWPLDQRRDLLQLLAVKRLNVFSSQMQQRYSYLLQLLVSAARSMAPDVSKRSAATLN